MRSVEGVEVSVEGDVLTGGPYFVFGGVDAVSQDVPVHSDPDECALNAGQSKALILKLTPVDVKASKGAERGNAREISGGASEELVDRFCLDWNNSINLYLRIEHLVLTSQQFVFLRNEFSLSLLKLQSLRFNIGHCFQAFLL